MKQLIGHDTGSYSFNASAGTVTFTGVNLTLDQILTIVDATVTTMIYCFAVPTLSGTLVGNVLTLEYNCSALQSNDVLQIYVDIPQGQSTQLVTAVPVDVSDHPVWGDQRPMQQHEADSQGAAFNEMGQITFDPNMQDVFGSQSLINNSTNRLKVEAAQQPEQTVYGVLSGLGQEVRMNLTGQGTVTLQLTGTWVGTIAFQVSSDGQNWYNIQGCIPQSSTPWNLNLSSNGMIRFPTAGIGYFRIVMQYYTSGIARIILMATPLIIPVQSTFVMGSMGATLVQKAIAYELATSDSSNYLTKDALQNTDAWNPLNATYYIGDTCSYNGQIYQCIASHSALTAGQTPANATYWQLDVRQNKSLVTVSPDSAPMAPRIRVKPDSEDYIRRLEEMIMFNQMIQVQQEMVMADYNLSVMQQGVGQTQMGKAYAMGGDKGSYYNFIEVR